MTDPDEGTVRLAAGSNPPPLKVEQHPAHVLIVDDDPRVRSLETAVLRAHGFRSTECVSGLDALRLASSECFDAVLLDIRMPGIDGWEVLRTLRSSGFDAPVLMVSGDATILEAAERGADGLLMKPFTVAELVEALRSALREHSLCSVRRERDSSGAHDGPRVPPGAGGPEPDARR